MTATDCEGPLPEPIRIIHHTLIDICDELGGATLSLQGNDVSFVVNGATGSLRLSGRLGDWLVAESSTSWRIVPDVEFGRLQGIARRGDNEVPALPADIPTSQRVLAP